MKRFGCRNHPLRSMNENDLFLSRLHLLIIVVKAALQGYPVGKYRKEASLKNAGEVHKMISRMDLSFIGMETSHHLFKERVKLLTIMVSAIIGENYPMGVHRREAVFDNIKIIESCAFSQSKRAQNELDQNELKLFDKVLKVA